MWKYVIKKTVCDGACMTHACKEAVCHANELIIEREVRDHDVIDT